MAAFAAGGTSYGMAEESLAFYAIVLPVFIRAGYESRDGRRGHHARLWHRHARLDIQRLCHRRSPASTTPTRAWPTPSRRRLRAGHRRVPRSAILLSLVVDEIAVLPRLGPQPLDGGEDLVGLGDHCLAGLFGPVDVVAHTGHEVREAGGEFADTVVPRLVGCLGRAFLVREFRRPLHETPRLHHVEREGDSHEHRGKYLIGEERRRTEQRIELRGSGARSVPVSGLRRPGSPN